MNGLEAFLAPGTRLVGRLRFADKILAIGAVFCVPIAVLLYLYLAAQWTSSEFSAKERLGVRMLVPARAALQPLQDQREAARLALGGDDAAKRRLSDTSARVDAAFAAGDQTDREIGAELNTSGQWAALRKAWSDLKAKSAGLSVEASFAAHSALIRQLADFVLLIADNSNLTLDPDIDSYYLMDSAVVRLPALAELLAQTGAVGARLAARKDDSIDSRAELLVDLQRLDEHVATLAGNFAKIGKANPTVGTALAAPDERVRQTLAPFVKRARERPVDSQAGEIDAGALATLGGPAIQAVWTLFDVATNQLDTVVAARVERIYREVAVSMTLVAISLVAVGYLFLAFQRSVVDSIGHLAAGVESLAAGQLDRTLESHSQDELREVVAGINNAMRTLSQVVEAQQELKAKHDAGDIDSRLDETRLTGAYAEVARQINALLDAHIAVKFQFAGLVREYGEGNFSRDMPSLPGKKRQISDAAAEIKNSLQSLAAEIQTLASAANRGDFTVRGDESRFKHGFRDMVATLNQLAATSATGLNDVVRVLNAIANGDLTQRIEARYEGTFGQLKDDANTTVERLRDVVSQIKDAAEVIDIAAREINAGNSDLSGRTEEQASRLEETASAMDELSTTVKQNANSAREANDLARSSNAVANRGGAMVGRVIETMDAIQDSSRKIADIISVIDGIAFQTNILALNAAVEAARAGEQGRGFAVVATEVRGLAQRSATAAKEIKELIDGSSAKVDDGAKLVREAGKTMTEVVQSFQQVAGFVTRIADASVEQSAGIEQIAQAVGAIDEGTQQNAALVEEASNAAESLAVQAQTLVGAVAIFRLGDETSKASAALAAPVERRGPNRAKNVSRLPAAKRPSAPAVPAMTTTRAAIGSAGDGDWEAF